MISKHPHCANHRRMVAIVSVPIFAAAFAVVLFGDSWASAKLTHVFSEDGTRFVRIVPGTSTGDTYGFAGAPKGRWATAELYQRRPDRSYALVADVKLRNPVAPVDVLVSNGGAFLTLDNWHNVGYGDVAAIYNSKGALLRSYRLEDLYEKRDIAAMPASVSSRWWRCSPTGFVDVTKQTTVYVSEFRGGKFLFDLTTGAYAYEPGNAKCPSR